MADLTLTGTARDFSYLSPPAGQKPLKHPDFETYTSGLVTGIVSDTLGTDEKPVFVNGRGAVTSSDSFSSWFNDNPNYNVSASYSASFHSTTNSSVVEHDELQGSSPINVYGNQGQDANYSFTEELHTTFTYHGNEDLHFNSDDELFVFINKKLAVDLGGTHTAVGQNLDLSTSGSAAANFGLVLGGTYSIDIFHAERHSQTSGVSLQIPTQSTLSINGITDGTIDQQEIHNVTFSVGDFDNLTGKAVFTDGKQTVDVTINHNGTFSADLSGLQGTISSSLMVGDQVSAVGNQFEVAAATSSSGGGGGGGTTPTPANPTITGTHATTDLAEATVQPFGASAAGGPVVIGDTNANATETLTIALQGGGGTLADGAGLSGLAFANGVYTLTGTAAAVTSELDALTFTPTNGTPGATVNTTFTVAVASSTGTSATDSGTVVSDTAAAVSPTIRGTHATNDTSEAPVLPFSGVVIADANANATDSLVITLTGGGGALSGPGLTGSGNSYALAATDPTTLTNELDALTFVPTAGALEQPNPTTFTLTDTSSAGRSAIDSGTVVTDTAFNSRNPAPTPDAVSIAPVVSYANGVFTLTGTASSTVGVAKVEIMADVDGTPTDLGAAVVDANGNFTFSDAIGAQTQSFITATETGNAGSTAVAQASYSLMGGLAGGKGEQDRYSTDGSALTATDVFKANGSQNATLLQPGQTFASSFFDTFHNGGAPDTTFVFNPGFGRDVVDLFRVDGNDHDTLNFKGSDYGNSVATVLNSSRDTAAGLLLTDPTASSPGGGPGTHDTLLLKGITKQQLAANQGDITFHA